MEHKNQLTPKERHDIRRAENIFEAADYNEDRAWEKVKYLTWGKRNNAWYARYRWYVAATVMLAIGLFTLLYLPLQPAGDSLARSETIRPGKPQAELILANGETIVLQTGSAIRQPGAEISVDTVFSELQYVGRSSESGTEAIYNTLKVPRGGEYTLVLSDGTKIWMNSASAIRYPVTFDAGKREIYLEGEAYFEVARDESRPFYVGLKDGIRIQVLGTSFNVQAYDEDTKITAVLEKGAICMQSGQRQLVLKPGQCSTFDRQSGDISVEDVDTRPYTAWHNGQFVFDNVTVEDILKQLARWYDVDIFYRCEQVKNVLFSGDVKRYETIDKILQAMEISGEVHFEIKGRTILVSDN